MKVNLEMKGRHDQVEFAHNIYIITKLHDELLN